MYGQLTFNKVAETIQWRKASLFNQRNFDSHTELTQKWIRDQNIELKTVHHLEENKWENIYGFGFSKVSFDMTPKTYSMK